MLVSGRSTLGKTTLAVKIIIKQFLPQVQRLFAVCPTFWTQDALIPLRRMGCFPRENVFTRVTDDVFDKIYRECSKRECIQHGEGCVSSRCERIQIPTLLFVDDAAAEASTNKGNKGSFARLCIASPHLKLSIIGIFQRMTAATVSFRDNTENLISFVPTKVQDVKCIIDEFNPSPAHPQSANIVRNALVSAWDRSRFCFIQREAFNGKVKYYSGFKEEVVFNK